MIDLAKLDSMPKAELVTLAQQVGAKHHHMAGEKTIITAIKNHVLAPPKPQEMKHVAEKPKAPVYHNTPEEVEETLAPIKAKSPNFHTTYDREENTWVFQWRYESGRIGREECGNLDIPLRVIKRRAEKIAQGPLVLRSKQEFGMITDPGRKDSYTNVVM